MLITSIFSFSQQCFIPSPKRISVFKLHCRLQMLSIYASLKICCLVELTLVLFTFGSYCCFKPFPRRQILDSSKLKEFAYNNSQFDENGKKFSKWVENTGKLLFMSNFSFSPGVFKRLVLQTHKNKGLFGKRQKQKLKKETMTVTPIFLYVSTKQVIFL